MILKILILLLSVNLVQANVDPLELKRSGTLLRLHGNYDGAQRIYQQLIDQYPDDAIGYVFNLNTLLTRLTWDERQTEFDEQIRKDARSALTICERSIGINPGDYLGYYYCGQAHITMSYLSAMRGEYYQAGRHGNLAIKRLERTLQLKPELIDAKLHLGVAYYHADNIPPFLKALSRFLWFIPQGNADKSLPYLEQVSIEGDFFPDVAKYIYADLLVNHGIEGMQKATQLLRQLSSRYPDNRRFRLRLISLLLQQGNNTETLEEGRAYLAERNQVDLDEGLVSLWMTRAHIGLNNIEAAKISIEKAIKLLNAQNELPAWGTHLLLLTRGQLSDLSRKRSEALINYERILTIQKSDYVNPDIVSAAENGLRAPFRIQ